MGLSLPDHGYHAPNENFDWGQAGGGIVAFAKYFEEVAALPQGRRAGGPEAGGLGGLRTRPRGQTGSLDDARRIPQRDSAIACEDDRVAMTPDEFRKIGAADRSTGSPTTDDRRRCR